MNVFIYVEKNLLCSSNRPYLYILSYGNPFSQETLNFLVSSLRTTFVLYNEMDINNVHDLVKSIDELNIDNIPAWAAILINGIKILSVQLETVSNLTERVQKLEEFKQVSEVVSSRLENDNKRLRSIIESLGAKIDDQEQRSRNMCLLFYGIEEKADEDTDDVVLKIVNETLELQDFRIDDIQRSHRVGPNGKSQQQARQLRSSQSPSKPKTRPIIVRFSNYRDRYKIFKVKKGFVELDK